MTWPPKTNFVGTHDARSTVYNPVEARFVLVVMARSVPAAVFSVPDGLLHVPHHCVGLRADSR